MVHNHATVCNRQPWQGGMGTPPLHRLNLALLATAVTLLVLLPTPAQASDGGVHGLLAIGEVYDAPGNYLTRATVATWQEPLAFSRNLYSRVDVALARPLLDWLDALPQLGPGQRNLDFRLDLGTLPLAFGPVAAGAAVSLLDTTTFHFSKKIGNVGPGDDWVTGFGLYAVAAATLGERMALVAHTGTAWVSEGLEHTNTEVVAHLRIGGGMGLVTGWARGYLSQGNVKLLEYQTFSVGLETLAIQ